MPDGADDPAAIWSPQASTGAAADGVKAATAVDFAALFDAIPTQYLVMSPDLVIVEANRAYLGPRVGNP